MRVLDELLPEPGAFYVMDRVYLDFRRRYRFHQREAASLSGEVIVIKRYT